VAGSGLATVVHAVALLLMLGWILHLGRGLFVPVVSSVLVVYVIVGLSRLTRMLPVLGTRVPLGLHYLVATLVIGVLLVEMVAVFTANLSALAVRAPQFESALIGILQNVADRYDFDATLAWESFRRDMIGSIDLQATLRSGLASAASLLGGVFFVMLNVAFMLLEQRSFYQKLGLLTSDPARSARILAVVSDINDRVGRYLAVKTLINVVLGVVSYGIMLVAGVEFAVFWAIVIGLLNYIPYIGSIIGVAFPVAMAVAQFGELEPVLVLLVALVAAQVTMGNVIEPVVMGRSLNLSPYVILIGLTAWSSLWGIAGAIVSVPITAVIVIVLSEFDTTRPLAVLLSKDGRLDAG
jgi:predicted PurR-regulated permease PerM